MRSTTRYASLRRTVDRDGEWDDGSALVIRKVDEGYMASIFDDLATYTNTEVMGWVALMDYLESEGLA